MTLHQGFSLVETLIALLLISNVSINLLSKQWQALQLLNHSIENFQSNTLKVNQKEQGIWL